MGADLGNAIVTSAKAIGEVIVLGIAGYLGSQHGLLTHDATRHLSRIIYFILMPSLILSLSINFTVENFQKWYILPLFSLAHCAVGGFLTGSLGRLLRVQKPDLRMMILATAFDNWAALPLTLLAGISKNWDALKGNANAGSEGQAMCVLYSIPWTIVFFSAGLKFLRGGEAKHPPKELAMTPPPAGSLRSEASLDSDGMHLLLDPSMATSRSDEVAERLKGAATHRFDQALKPKKKAEGKKWLEAPPEVKPVAPGKKHEWLHKLWAQVLPLIQVPSIAAQFIGIFIGLVTPVRETFFGEGPLSFIMDALTMFGKTLLPIATIVLGASMQSTMAQVLAQRAAQKKAADVAERGEVAASGKSGPQNLKAEQSNGSTNDHSHHNEPIKLPSSWVTVATCLSRLVLMPAIFFPLSLWIFRSGLMGPNVDPLLQLVILLQACMPGAEQVVVMYKLYGFTERAASLSFIFLVEYLSSIVTISASLVIAMSLIQ